MSVLVVIIFIFGQIFDVFGTHDLPFYSFLFSLIEQSVGSDKLFKVDVEP